MMRQICKKAIFGFVFAIASFLTVTNVSAATFNEMSLRDQTKAVLLAKGMIQCLKTHGVKQEVVYDDFANNSYAWMVNESGKKNEVPVGYLIDDSDGLASCDELFNTDGEQDTKYSGWYYFGFNNMSKEKVLKEVFGYRQAADSGDIKSKTYTLSIEATDDAPIYYSAKGETYKDGKIKTSITLIAKDEYASDIIFDENCRGFCWVDRLGRYELTDDSLHEMYHSLHEMYLDDPASVTDEVVKERFVEYLWMLMVAEISLPEEGIIYAENGGDLKGQQMNYNDLFGTSNFYPTLKEFTERYLGNVQLVSSAIVEESGTYTVTNNDALLFFEKYLGNEFFGLNLNAITITSFGFQTFNTSHFPVQAYYHYLDTLRSSRICNAKFVKINEPENRLKYDSTENEFFVTTKVVGDNGELIDLYADWSGGGIGSFVSMAKKSSNIPVGNLATAYSYHDAAYSDCRDIADRLKYISMSLSEENRAKVKGLATITDWTEEQNSNNTSTSDGEGSNTDSDYCYDAGVEGISWLLCPSISNMTKYTDGMTRQLNNWLAIDAVYYEGGGKANEAWNYFRNFANIAIIIILLVVVVSQLTGYGIDNYGIKKILPRLIVMAVLINLSFFICQLAIDLSNILGDGLNNLLRNIGGNLKEGIDAEGVFAYIVDTLLAAAAGVGTAAGGIITIANLANGGGAMLVISIALMVLTAMIAILMFFLAIGARFVIIIVFTAIAPLAFACYVLPNTQKLFKKWWDIFKAALIVYPICGALYGASFIIRAIILNSDANGGIDFMMALIAVAAPYLPFLLLPSLTKGAIASLGKLGGALSGIGASLKGGLSKGQTAIQHTDAYKNQQERARRNMTASRAGFKVNRKTGELMRDKDGNLIQRKMGKFGKAWRGGDSGMAAARAQVLRDQEALRSENSMMKDDLVFEAGLISAEKRADASEIANWETLVKGETRDGANEVALFDKFKKFREDGNEAGARAVARIAGRRPDTAARFLDEIKKTKFSEDERKFLGSVAKEIAEGETSRNYLSSSPLGFDFVSDINKDPEKASLQYDGENGWLSKKSIKTAMDNYVSNSSQLVGVKTGSLKEMIDLMESGQMDEATKARLRTLATDTIANRDTGPWDSTKAAELCAMSGGAFEFKDGKIIDHRELTVDHSSGSSGANDGVNATTNSNATTDASGLFVGDAESAFREARRTGNAPLPNPKR